MGDYFRGPWQKRQPHEANRQRFAGLARPIRLFDLGAAGGTPPPFCLALEAVEPINFEPDQRSDVEAGQENRPLAIGPADRTELHLNRRPTTSSLLPACRRVVDRYDWSHFGHTDTNIFDTVERQPVRTLGLDEAIAQLDLPQPDFVKLDVQGLTFEVLDSGRRCLGETVLGLQAEVEFLECYTGQKSFAPVHALLDEAGFEVFRVSNLGTWRYKTGLPIRHRPGQHTFCDLLYFRGIDTIGRDAAWTPERAVQMLRLLLLHDLIDAAAAYWERFVEHGLLADDTAEALRALICNWPGALEFFYHEPEASGTGAGPTADRPSYEPPPPPPPGLLDKTPRQILAAVKRRLTGAS